MIRKIISITQDLNQLIALTAQAERKPQAEVIREKLRAGFATTKGTRNGGDALLALAQLGKDMGVTTDDPQLSRNIDKYLYEV